MITACEVNPISAIIYGTYSGDIGILTSLRDWYGRTGISRPRAVTWGVHRDAHWTPRIYLAEGRLVPKGYLRVERPRCRGRVGDHPWSPA